MAEQIAPSDSASESKTVGKYPVKVIQCGFHRTGSTSVAKALEILGFGPVWHCARNSRTMNAKLSWWENNNICEKIESNQAVDFDEWLDMIQCPTIMDVPSSVYWETLMEYYPNAKLILIVRDFDGWYKSRQFIDEIMQSMLLKTFAVFAVNTIAVRWLIYDYFPRLEKILPVLNTDKQIAKRHYEERAEYVKQICESKSKQLLVYRVQEGWEPLCSFLEVDIPKDETFPHKNSEETLTKRITHDFIEFVFFNNKYAILLGVAVIYFAFFRKS